MIVTRTPFRVSFFGGGTDYPAWFREHGGAVFAGTINKYCYITCRHLPPFFDHKHRIVYSRIENVKNIGDIQHPAVKAVFEWANVKDGMEVHYDGDLPARSGLGSSSSFTVGLVNAIRALNGKMTDKESLARDAIHIEQEIIGENVGSQDQVSAAFGGLNQIEFNRNGSFSVSPVIISSGRREELRSHLMLFFTGFSRVASEIAASKVANFKHRGADLKAIRQMVDESLAILQNQNTPITLFGKLLADAWLRKRALSDRVSTPEVDQLYETALQAGAIGGKLLGAGGGGFMLIFAKPEFHSRIRDRLSNLVYVPFDFEDTGSRVVLYHPKGL